MRIRTTFVAAACCAAAALPARGQVSGPQVTLDAFAGGMFADDVTKPPVLDAFAGGGRVGIQLQPWIRVEGTFTVSSRESIRLNHTGADLVVDLLPDRRMCPYIGGGWAQIEHDPDPGETQTLNGWEACAGLRVRIVPRIFFRLDIRDAIVEQDVPHAWLHDVIATGGLHVALGGRPLDSDGDGVADSDDTCPGTPDGAVVDAAGCPQDSDGDGVADGFDRCAASPAGAVVDARGCPQDADGDGVPDGLDRCAGTLAGATVDANGCTQDADRDSVLDGLDRCPDTPAGAIVDATGCPLDGDGDGVPDGLDRCPETQPSAAVDSTGCPVITNEMERRLLETGKVRLEGVSFASGGAKLSPQSAPVLDEVGEILVRRQELVVEIGGHTDSSGDARFNEQLSHRRARAVLDYLLAKFPTLTPSRLSAKGYGASEPAADNATKAGRALNRRVEVKVIAHGG
jgi:outer membrane protein OmpA-like peptidoglycan-associated protein